MSEMPETRAPARSGRVAREDVHVRNHDDAEHELWVHVVDADGELVFERSYRLAGHACASELDALPPGEYEVEVELDGLRRWTDSCEIADATTGGILVETGNGTVSITGVVG